MGKYLEWDRLAKAVPKWYRDVKFGMFFHWGPYSVPAYMNEWYSHNMYITGLPQNVHHLQHYGRLERFGYKDFYNDFTGKKFDPDEWAELADRAGARYAGPVAEHADNFSMWNSRVNPVNSVNYGPKRDVFGECARAFRKRGIRVLAPFHHQWLWGWFMSTNPDADVYMPENERYYGPAVPLEAGRMYPYRLPDEKFNRIWLEKIKEVIDLYSPDVLYFDSRAFIITEEYRYRMLEYYYLETGHENGIITYKGEDFPQSVGVLDMERGSSCEIRSFVWQTDDRLEDNITWCYVNPPRYRSAGRIIQQLCDNISKNGNLLLNVGPDKEGCFPEEAKRELYKIGDWLKLNQEAVYGTRPWVIAEEGRGQSKDIFYGREEAERELKGEKVELQSNPVLGEGDYRFTQNEEYLYVFFFEWPKDGCLRIRALQKKEYVDSVFRNSVWLLGSNLKPAAFMEGDCMCIRLPYEKPCEYAYVLKIRKADSMEENV